MALIELRPLKNNLYEAENKRYILCSTISPWPRGQRFIPRPRLGPSALRNFLWGELNVPSAILAGGKRREDQGQSVVSLYRSRYCLENHNRSETKQKKKQKKREGREKTGGRIVNNGPSRAVDGTTKKLPHLRVHTHTQAHRHALPPGERCCKPNFKKKKKKSKNKQYKNDFATLTNTAFPPAPGKQHYCTKWGGETLNREQLG